MCFKESLYVTSSGKRYRAYSLAKDSPLKSALEAKGDKKPPERKFR